MTIYEDPSVRPIVDLVRQACRLSREIRDGLVVSALKKDDRSPVTVADYALQSVIGRFLKDHSPVTPLVGEERGAALRSDAARPTLDAVTTWVRRLVPDATESQIIDWIDQGAAEPTQRFWTLDPIDGTKGFLRGNHYAVALALIERGEVTLGVIGCPTLDPAHPDQLSTTGSLALAAKGRGAWLGSLEGGDGWQPLRVSPTTALAEAALLESFESGHTNQSQTAQMMQRLGMRRPPIRMDSLGKFVVLARGTGEILCRVPPSSNPAYRENIWDQAAGALVVTEAGGMVTDLDGKQLDFSRGRKLLDNRGVLSTNGRLHAALLEALRG